jgi:uncharacterized protein YdhG (YjbR/CyaY superfamily)
MAKNRSPAVDEYIASFPKDVQRVLRELRRTIRAEVPDAEETISYQMPTYVSGRHRVYFGGFKQHVGMYPPLHEAAPFKKQLARYEGPKGNLRFPLDEPLPLPLIRKMVRFQLKAKGIPRRGG